MLVDYIIVALVLIAFSVYGIHFTRIPRPLYQELGLNRLIFGVSVLGIFMGVVLIVFSF